MFSVQLGMRRDLSQRGLGAFNQWSYADWNLDGAYPVGDTLPKSPVFFLAANSLKDGSKGMAPPGCTSLEIITMVPFKRFERWKDLPMGRRGAEYEGEKKRLVDWVLAHVEARFPKLLGDVEVQEAWSPLTCASYANAVEGGAYGPANVPEQTGRHRFSPLTPLSNVFLAGAGASSCGVGACLQSGLLAADLARDSTARVPRGRRPVLERWREALGWST
jgi:all-trans-retinol 13,14-reductase